LPRVSSQVVRIDDVDLLLPRIEEFGDEPIVCTKDLHHESQKLVLRAGRIYVRTADARCVAIDSGESMRAFLDLALQKRGEALLAQIRLLVGAPEIVEASAPTEPYAAELASADQLFGQEELAAPNPYWYLSVWPQAYEADRIQSNARLWEIRREAVVSIRGWDFPHVDRTRSCIRRRH
jgi:hypothetical protein